ncbi:MAG: nuclear transport factor 2 family protein [Burkholderiales bacterium]|nr:nuclear transport factor 2 family protein [Burkholderiales bacterium]
MAAVFKRSNGDDDAALESCLADDVVVHDEGGTYRRRDAALCRLREAQRKYAYVVEPLAATYQANTVEVVARVACGFRGGSAELDHVFQLADGKIRALQIQ